MEFSALSINGPHRPKSPKYQIEVDPDSHHHHQIDRQSFVVVGGDAVVDVVRHSFVGH